MQFSDENIQKFKGLEYEFFVTGKNILCKQYVNTFLLRVKTLEKSEKIRYDKNSDKFVVNLSRREEMNLIKRNICTILTVALLVTLGFADCAFAESQDIMDTAEQKAVEVFQSVKSIIFIVGGFGLVVLAFAAIFGKLDWKKFTMLAVGLAILAAAGAVIEYATGESGLTDSSTGFGDTFGQK